MMKYLIAAFAALALAFSTPAFATETEGSACSNKTVKEQLEIGYNLLKSKNKEIVSQKLMKTEEAHNLMNKVKEVLHVGGIPGDDEYDTAYIIQVDTGYLVFLAKGDCFQSSGFLPNGGWKLIFGSDA